MWCGARRIPPRPRFVECAVRLPGSPGASQRGRLRGIVRAQRLDDGASLVAGGSNDLLEEGGGDAVHIVFLVDDQEVDRADEAAGPD